MHLQVLDCAEEQLELEVVVVDLVEQVAGEL